MTATEKLVDYANPPVVETILGVQFERLPNFRNAHLGAFWKCLDPNEWPTVYDAPLLPAQPERFTEPGKWGQLAVQVTVSQDPASRLQIKNKDGDRMIQIQNNRIHYNWLGQEGGKYPGYLNVRKEMEQVLTRFADFAEQEKLGAFEPNQWEATYLNHVAKGTVWNTPQDWAFFRPLGAVPTLDGLVEGESFSGEWHFVIPEQQGRLHVQWQHGAKFGPEQMELIVLTFTARGRLLADVSPIDGVLRSLDLGRKTIVGSFQQMMSDEANRYWGLSHAGS